MAVKQGISPAVAVVVILIVVVVVAAVGYFGFMKKGGSAKPGSPEAAAGSMVDYSQQPGSPMATGETVTGKTGKGGGGGTGPTGGPK
jgi:hypothetical protein